MALEAALADLCSQLKRLSAQVDIAEKRALDMPEGQDHYLAGEIGDAARDATGWLRKVRRKAQRARRSLAQGTELPRVRNALTNCKVGRLSSHISASLNLPKSNATA